MDSQTIESSPKPIYLPNTAPNIAQLAEEIVNSNKATKGKKKLKIESLSFKVFKNKSFFPTSTFF